MKDIEISSKKSSSILIGLSNFTEGIKAKIVDLIPESTIRQLQNDLFRKSSSDKIIESEINSEKSNIKNIQQKKI